MATHITGMNHGYNLPNWQVDDYVADMDTGDVSRIGLGGHKGVTLWHVGNLHRPAPDSTAQAVFDTVAAKLGALVPRCN